MIPLTIKTDFVLKYKNNSSSISEHLAKLTQITLQIRVQNLFLLENTLCTIKF
jgi:hypothetical protein